MDFGHVVESSASMLMAAQEQRGVSYAGRPLRREKSCAVASGAIVS